MPFKDPRLAMCVASRTTEIQGHRQVRCPRRGGPRTPSTTTDTNLDCALVESELVLIDTSQKYEGRGSPLPPPVPPLCLFPTTPSRLWLPVGLNALTLSHRKGKALCVFVTLKACLLRSAPLLWGYCGEPSVSKSGGLFR